MPAVRLRERGENFWVRTRVIVASETAVVGIVQSSHDDSLPHYPCAAVIPAVDSITSAIFF
jgi:hypothetical protein